MIFSCGLTADEAWKREKARRESWHDFFALWPRVVSVDEQGNQRCAWLQTIKRKGEFCQPSMVAQCYGVGPWWSWSYSLDGDKSGQA